MFYIFSTCILIFISIQYYLPFDPHTYIGFNMAIIDSTPKHKPNHRPYSPWPIALKFANSCYCKVASTISIEDSPIVSPQFCAKSSPQYQSKITKLCLHNLVGSPHPCTMPNLISVNAGPTYFLCRSNWRERKRVSNVEVILLYLVNTVLLFYILTSFKWQADEKHSVFKLI